MTTVAFTYNFKTKSVPKARTILVIISLAIFAEEIYNIGYLSSSSLNLEDSLFFSAISTRRDMS
jgi:hypothetical protein